MKKTVWILLAGDFALPPRLPAPEEIVIAVDGGIYHAADLTLMPDVWLGDFDSSDSETLPKYAAVPKRRFAKDKDETDFELALKYVAQYYPQTEQLMIIGGLGKEKDHEFANLWVLPAFGMPTIFFGADEIRLFAQGPVCWHLQGRAGNTISLFALTPLHGIFSAGLRWSLHNASLSPFAVRASRNCFSADRANICWDSGCGLIFLTNHTTAVDFTVSEHQR